MTATHHRLERPDVTLAYRVWGHPGQPPILLLHGLADHSGVWAALGPALAEDYHVVAPDLRGHGDSSNPTRGYDFATVISDLEHLTEHLGWSRFHAVGHSWTGKLLPLWAQQDPARFASLTLVDPFIPQRIPRAFVLTYPILFRTLPFLQGLGPFSSYTEAEQKAQRRKPLRGWNALQKQVFEEGVEPLDDGHWTSKFSRHARDQVFDAVMHTATLTKPLIPPTLFIQPEHGINRFQWQLRPYETHARRLERRSVPGHHWPFLTHPESFNETVAEFLHRYPIEAGPPED